MKKEPNPKGCIRRGAELVVAAIAVLAVGGILITRCSTDEKLDPGDEAVLLANGVPVAWYNNLSSCKVDETTLIHRTKHSPECVSAKGIATQKAKATLSIYLPTGQLHAEKARYWGMGDNMVFCKMAAASLRKAGKSSESKLAYRCK